MRKRTDGLLRILVALQKLDEAPASTIRKEAGIGNYYTAKTILEELKKIGFVEEKYDPGPPGKIVYRLTQEGRGSC